MGWLSSALVVGLAQSQHPRAELSGGQGQGHVPVVAAIVTVCAGPIVSISATTAPELRLRTELGRDVDFALRDDQAGQMPLHD